MNLEQWSSTLNQCDMHFDWKETDFFNHLLSNFFYNSSALLETCNLVCKQADSKSWTMENVKDLRADPKPN